MTPDCINSVTEETEFISATLICVIGLQILPKKNLLNDNQQFHFFKYQDHIGFLFSYIIFSLR